MNNPIVMLSSYPPRLCGIATFCEEAREFIQKHNPDRPVMVISHTDGSGDGVIPIMDNTKRNWWKPVAEEIHKLKPYAVHIQHEYGLYEYLDERGHGDSQDGLLSLMDAINDVPTVIEPHTVHGRLTEHEADFIFKMSRRIDVVLFKCHYQKWRLDWNFAGRGWETPRNIMVVPHGARSDKRYSLAEVVELREELGLSHVPKLSTHLVGLIGWIQSNKRWDLLTGMWEEIAEEIESRTGEQWDLLAAGTMRDPNHKDDYEKYKEEIQFLAKKGLAHYYEFVPRGDIYYKMMALCDFIVLPSTDETQSGTLARIIALNKPYITTAPMEGLTAQTIESGGGMLFTNKDLLKRQVIELACNENLRLEYGERLKHYLENVVCWDVVAKQYNEAYELAREAKKSGKPVTLPKEW
ncbi:MAG: glycosyltransferase [bacterium]|nr:glycosyltransferase [bacterium]